MISSLRLQHFRSYQDSSFEFEPGVNIIVGPNASGKTNLLEAILVLCRGRSYRAGDQELVEHGQEWARLDAFTDHNQGRTLKLEAAQTRLAKTFVIDGTVLHRLPPVRSIAVVLFEPNQLQQLSSSPEQRRNFMDDLLEQTVTSFGTTRRAYLRALAQRNRLLKQERADKDQLFVWSLRLSELGAVIAEARLELLKTFNAKLTATYQEIAHSQNNVTLGYDTKMSSRNYASSLLKRLEEQLELDRARGFTGSGPHRDDMTIDIDSQPLQSAASRGESRTLLLALKIQEAAIIEEKHGHKPLLLLDDVFGELDETRRLHLTRFLSDYQSFITTPDIEMTRRLFKKTANYITTL